VDEPAPVPEWSRPGDPRGAITLDNMLRMSSGLEFGEVYEDPLSDVCIMLFSVRDAAAYAADKPLETEPGNKWYYSSGTTNVISRIVRDAIGGTQADYFAFPRNALFDRIGMRSAVIEPDPSGTFVGSSYMYATARDWARFGLLYLQDGVWDGERILPEGWVDYSRKPTPGSPGGVYGAHFWLNPTRTPDESTGSARVGLSAPRLPADLYQCLGHEGQSVTIIPSRKTVVVRLGLSQAPGAWDLDSFIANVLEALPDKIGALSG
jgi:CubicO group peptidase (beta-lactamase class C family)